MDSIRTLENEGLVSKTDQKEIVFNTFLRNHDESLKLANNTYRRQESNLWVVVISYYSMFYLASAYIYAHGFKVGSYMVHQITLDMFEHLSKKQLPSELIESYTLANQEAHELSNDLTLNLKHEKRKRGVFQYETTEKIKQAKAKTSLLRAKRFSEQLLPLLE